MAHSDDRKPDGNSDRSRAPVLVLALSAVLLLPLLYVLAIGPLIWLDSSGRMKIGPDSLIARMYWPLEAVAQSCPPVGAVIVKYGELWQASNPAAPPPAYQSYPPPAPLPPATTPTPPATIPPAASAPRAVAK